MILLNIDRCRYSTGTRLSTVDLSQLPNLKVTVLAGLVQPSEEPEEPSWFGNHEARRHVTDNRPCGAGYTA